MWKKACIVHCVCLLAILIVGSCAPVPDVRPEPKPEVKPPPPLPPSDFVMKSYHEAMNAEMRISYERADEILIGLYTGNYNDKQFGLIHYFDDFKIFDKTSLSWGPAMKVVVQVQTVEFKPEIIKKNEFKQLSQLDRIGICWDPYKETRNIYLCEGQKMLIFLQTGYDEVNNRSFRNLIDAYPVTPVCRADEVFDSILK